MYCRNRGSVLLRGIAAFLLLVMMGSSTAFAAAATEDSATEAQTIEVATVNLEGKDEAGEEAVEEIAEDEDVVMFSQSEEVTARTVYLYYNKKIKYESGRTHDFHVVCDGEKTVAYCIQPSAGCTGSRKYSAKPYNDELMTKVLYYCYGNPGYGKMKEYLQGVSRKSCYKGSSGAYVLSHILVSYVYDDESSKSDAFMGCSSGTKKLVKKLLAAIKKWPDPVTDVEIGLSADKVQASWDDEKDIQITPDIEVTGTEGNSVDIPVPDGATLVSGEESVSGGSKTVTVGESFHFTATDTVNGTYESPSIECSMKGFQPYLIKVKKKQNQLFSISTAGSVSFSVEWMDADKIAAAKKSAEDTTEKSAGETADETGEEKSATNETAGKASETSEEKAGTTSEDAPATGDETMLLLLLAGIGISLLFGAFAIVTKN